MRKRGPQIPGRRNPPEILCLLSGKEDCVCNVIDLLGITQSKASRHLRYLYHLGWVTDRRDGLWMNYRLTVTPGSPRENLLKLLTEMLAPLPKAQGLRGQLAHILEAKSGLLCAKRLTPDRHRSPLPET